MTIYRQKINIIHRELRISESYENDYGLTLQQEQAELIGIENDIYGRFQKLAPVTASAWKIMKDMAKKEEVILSVVSAFRSVDRQKIIIQKKVESGQAIAEVLKVCAAPGYSEHHTGRALDLTSSGCEPLSEVFESTEAFSWLIENANYFSFSLSYPKGNKAGISYEPWHWAHNQT